MSVVFFGDSFTSAENNHFNGFAEKLGLEFFENKGVSGTTIGDYSLYPVGKNDLLSLIFKNKQLIEKTDYIFIEYGINDVASKTLNYTTELNIIVDLNKCLDLISQYNPNAKVIYLLPTYDHEIIEEIAKSQYEYLKEYLPGYIITDNFIEYYVATYYSLVTFIKAKNLPIITLCEDKDQFISNLDTDNMHPSDKGYELIAKRLRKELCKYDENFNNWFK